MCGAVRGLPVSHGPKPTRPSWRHMGDLRQHTQAALLNQDCDLSRLILADLLPDQSLASMHWVAIYMRLMFTKTFGEAQLYSVQWVRALPRAPQTCPCTGQARRNPKVCTQLDSHTHCTTLIKNLPNVPPCACTFSWMHVFSNRKSTFSDKICSFRL